MPGSIVQQGVELMLFGMGTVIVFLGLLVLATTFMSRLVGRLFPEPEPVSPPVRVAVPPTTNDAELVAVISAAIHQHRIRKRKDEQ